MKIINPVLKGFNPDPSMIRVDDTYYIATSTFEWFPGIQIHQSKDLINWELLTHPLSTTTLLDMKANPDSGGVWAPDISYADGLFWIVYSDVKVVEGSFKDVTNYLITSPSIMGPWSDPIVLNGVGFDASLFHDEDGKKYLVQMEWDHREYMHPFHGIKLTEYSHEEKRLLPETSKIIWNGTEVKLTEAPHIYKIGKYYYLFCAEGGTVYTHQQVVARSTELYGEYESQPDIFLTAFDSPRNPLQKCGHGSLVETQTGEWYFAHLTGRPWHHETESVTDPRGWCTLGRETAIQKVEWDENDWPYIVGGKQGSLEVEAPSFVTAEIEGNQVNSQFDDFDNDELDINFNTVRVPFDAQMGEIKDSHLVLNGRGSFNNLHTNSLVARRWQAFEFVAETKVAFEPESFQQMAGLICYYNTRNWTTANVTWNEEKGRVIDLMACERFETTHPIQGNEIQVPEDVESVYFRVEVDPKHYYFSYSFDGENYERIDVAFDSYKLSDDYIEQAGFFTGAFVGMHCFDISGRRLPADFDYFRYEEK